ncbi:hypothetical protein PIB30_002891 [Stylosanthes scabra]|uniref:F-box domain-containing protein n=1 Tax=Stylosanthes scabra TaxID=79078 RepID=A0ABU6U538_9FABA|nr:hypothetical protein [Stylosanthes scabra]
MSVDASDLPHDLLSLVADDLGIIDLLRFRAVCKDWRSASSWSTAIVESMDDNPWLLVYGETSPLCLLKEGSREDMIYTLKLQEFNGSTCIASDHGWISPKVVACWSYVCFSEANINGGVWIQDVFGKIRYQLYNLVSSAEEAQCEAPKLWLGDKNPVNYILKRDPIDEVILTMPLEEKLGLDSSPSTLSISTCGTKFALQNEPSYMCGIIFSEKKVHGDDDEDHEGECQIHDLKGVWIQPRYFKISPHQTW